MVNKPKSQTPTLNKNNKLKKLPKLLLKQSINHKYKDNKEKNEEIYKYLKNLLYDVFNLHAVKYSFKVNLIINVLKKFK